MKETIKTTTFVCGWNEFNLKHDGNDVRRWQEAYFELLSWKNTWYLALNLDMCSTRDGEPFVRLIVKEKDKERTENYLKSLGYIGVKVYDTVTLKLYVDYDDKYDDVICDWDL